ncbi:MAG: co-chaperone DjlA [Gammaproteobacteria bacterium]|jgi:DnaJ like chaperone protein|nr:co-chaperone DjlA [Gammaproteobacteria bacterium]MDP6616743.1 co-chaperone DjlA [Gammaproteobacteria bacterium]MDP6695192.1 co-chaperone DjlA [Gammaproteobacteria bacterium]
MDKVNWTGKLIGAVLGFLLSKGSFTGAAVGFFIGHLIDGYRSGGLNRGSRRLGGFSTATAAERQRVFFESLFLAMGHLAKADGRVSEEEIRIARGIMHQWQLRPEEVQAAIELFSRGKQPDFPLDTQMQKLASACRGQPELTRTFLEILMEIPLGKGQIDAAERDVLWRIAGNLGVGRVEMAQLEALLRAQRSFGQQAAASSAAAELEQAYKALDIEPTATDKEVKTAYRRLMNQHHPDKLVAKGLPDSMLEVAKEKTREIRAAYERIRDHRGIK